jgi:hypothetical protein
MSNSLSQFASGGLAVAPPHHTLKEYPSRQFDTRLTLVRGDDTPGIETDSQEISFDTVREANIRFQFLETRLHC